MDRSWIAFTVLALVLASSGGCSTGTITLQEIQYYALSSETVLEGKLNGYKDIVTWLRCRGAPPRTDDAQTTEAANQ
jgi:hypothetical protein